MKLLEITSEYDNVPFSSIKDELVSLIYKVKSKQYLLDHLSKKGKNPARISQISDEIIDLNKQILFLRQDLSNKNSKIPHAPVHERVWSSKYIYFEVINNGSNLRYPARISGIDKNGREHYLLAVASMQLAQKLAEQFNQGDYRIPNTSPEPDILWL